MALADTGVAALQKAEQVNFDVILMDVQMPEVDGMRRSGFCGSRIHAARHAHSGRRAGRPCYAGDRERFLAAGADGYVSKPIQLKLAASGDRCGAGARGWRSAGSRDPVRCPGFTSTSGTVTYGTSLCVSTSGTVSYGTSSSDYLLAGLISLVWDSIQHRLTVR